MSWNTVKQIHLQALQKKYSRRKLRHLKYPGVDEIAVRMGHSWLTAVSGREAREKLDRLFAFNQPLHTAYLLKEELRSLWSCSRRAQAEPALYNRLNKVCAGGMRQLKKIARAIAAHRAAS